MTGQEAVYTTGLGEGSMMVQVGGCTMDQAAGCTMVLVEVCTTVLAADSMTDPVVACMTVHVLNHIEVTSHRGQFSSGCWSSGV